MERSLGLPINKCMLDGKAKIWILYWSQRGEKALCLVSVQYQTG